MKKKLSLLLAVISVLTAYSSCVSETAKDNTQTTAAEDNLIEETTLTDSVPDLNFNGSDFRVLARPTMYIEEMYVESDTGDVVDTAVFNRNQAIQERFNIKFVFVESSNSNYETDAQQIILAGSNDFELVLPHARAATMYGQEGLLVNWHDLDYIDLEMPWWNQNVVEEFTLYGKLYSMTGSLSYLSLGMSFGIFFNKNILNDLNIEYPYKAVGDGTWTFEKMSKIALDSSKDLNGDGAMDPEKDQFGYATADWHGCMNVLWAQEGRISGKDESGELVLKLYNDRTVNIYSRYFELTSNEGSYVFDSERSDQYIVEKLFGEGRAAILEFSLISMETMRSYDTVEFGVVPPPKYDESQEKYITMMNAATSMFCVPITIEDTKYVGAVLEAWAAKAHNVTIPAYFEVALKTKYSRDDESAAMLDLILKSATVDLIYYSNDFDPFSSAGYRLFHDKSHNFTSFYDKNEKSMSKKLEKFIEKYLET